MSNVTIEAVAGAPEATVRRLIGEGHPLHDGGEGKLLETYWLPDELERMISQHSEAQIDGLAAAAPACAVNPLDEECEACQ